MISRDKILKGARVVDLYEDYLRLHRELIVEYAKYSENSKYYDPKVIRMHEAKLQLFNRMLNMYENKFDF